MCGLPVAPVPLSNFWTQSLEERAEANNWERTKWTWETRLMELRGLHQHGSPGRQVCYLVFGGDGGAQYCALLLAVHYIFNITIIQYDNKTISLSSSKTKSSASQLE